MSKYEDFFNTPITDHKKFSLSLMSAVRELRSEELGIDVTQMVMDGDIKAHSSINNASIRPVETIYNNKLMDVPAHIKNVVSHWQDKASLFRGTRLPDNSGSFDFDGIHVTPQLDIANAYANGDTNSSTGIGRLMKHNEIGFVTSYEVSLDTQTWKNFQYEDSLKKGIVQSGATLQDLKNELIHLAIKDKSEFKLDENDIPSESMKKWNNVATQTNHYEVIIDEKTPVAKTFLRHKSGFIQIDTDKPEWDKLLARVQEASLRDFYEIKPLQSALKDLDNSRPDNNVQENIVTQARNIIQHELSSRLNAPWQANSMKDIVLSGSTYINDRPHIKNSVSVGSAMDSAKIVHDSKIQDLSELSEALYLNQFDKAQSLIEKINPVFEMESKKSITGNISAMRKNLFVSSENKLTM